MEEKQKSEDDERKLNKSMLNYYLESGLNPDRFEVEDKKIWDLHYSRRFNLYQNHLKIPFTLLRGASVLEIGCNSGENSLVLASAGANLTLVEPNILVYKRLKDLFKKFNFEKNMKLHSETIEDFNPGNLYDIAIVEGFLFSLPNRDEMVNKICSLLKPNGLGIISFMDRYGGLMEFTKKIILFKLCELSGKKFNSEESFEFAKKLYEEDFLKLNPSRNFKTWWEELVCGPSYKWHCLWSYPELFSLIEKSNCEFYSSSPQWGAENSFVWYKNIFSTKELHKKILNQWKQIFSFFIAGSHPNLKDKPAESEIVNSVYEFIKKISEYTDGSVNSLSYPEELDKYFNQSQDSFLIKFNLELKRLYDSLKSNNSNEIISIYLSSECLRNSWGSLYHYICFRKTSK